MGKIGEEITQKIKSAVKAKLTELGVEIDNELPDYIMVLVANKKNQEQMERDLELFLASNTVAFTSWLSNVLNKLQQVTVSNKTVKRTVSLKEQEDEKSDSENDFTRIKIKSEHLANDGVSQNSEDLLPVEAVIKNESELGDMDCLEIIPNEGILEEDGECAKGSGVETEGREGTDQGQPRKVHTRIVYSEREEGGTSEDKGRSTSRLGVRAPRGDKGSEPSGQTAPQRLTDAREILKRKATSSSLSSSRNSAKRNTNSTEKRRKMLPSSVQKLAETIQAAASEPRIPSLVRVTPRPVRRGGVQPNKNLLLRAVADAEKSLASHTTIQRKDASRNGQATETELKKRDEEEPELVEKLRGTITKMMATDAIDLLMRYYARKHDSTKVSSLKQWKEEIREQQQQPKG